MGHQSVLAEVGGIHGVDQSGIALVDQGATQLQRVGHLATLHGEGAWQQHEALYLLVACHVLLIALDAAVDHLVNGW